MKVPRHYRNLLIGLLVAAGHLMVTMTASGEPIVTLNVLNPPNEAGQIIVMSGDSVEVEYMIEDPLNETSPRDFIKLERISDGYLASATARGKELAGTSSVSTQKGYGADNLLGAVQVLYVSYETGIPVATAEQTVILVDNPAITKEPPGQAQKGLRRAQANELENRARKLQKLADAATNQDDALKFEQAAARLKQQADDLRASLSGL